MYGKQAFGWAEPRGATTLGGISMTFNSSFWNPAAWDPLFWGATTISSAALMAGAGVVLAKKLQDKFMGGRDVSYLKDSLPFHHMDSDQETLWCKNGAASKVLSLRGLLGDSLTLEQEQSLFQKREKWLYDMAENGTSFKVLTMREEVSRHLRGSYSNPILKTIHEKWMESFEKSYRNSHYIVFHEENDKCKPLVSFKDLMELNKKNASDPKTLEKVSVVGKLNVSTSMTLDALSELGPHILANEGHPYSPLLSFWSSMIHGQELPLKVLHNHLSDQMVGRQMAFDTEKGRILWSPSGEKGESLLGAIISLNKWDEESSPALIKELNAMPGRFILLQQLKGIPKFKALMYLMDQKKQNTMAFSSQKTMEEYEAAFELISSGEKALYSYHCSLLLLGEGEEDLQELLTKTRAIFRNYGVTPIQETSALESAWRSLFPGPQEGLRQTYLLSHNIAHLLTFPQDAKGLENCDWGKGAIRLFKTASGGSYSLQLHEKEDKEALANSLVIAPAGSGKTTLFQHLIGGALRHPSLRAYIFDRFNGTRIFTQSVGGQYIDFSLGDVPLNPLLGPDTPQERAFLGEFFQLLGQTKSPESFEESMRAVDILFRIPEERRILSDLCSGLFNVHGSMYQGLQAWVGQGTYGGWFNGQEGGVSRDALSLEQGRLFAFEMTDVQASPLTAAAVTHYLMHRIRMSIRGEACPHMIFIDETAPMLKNDLFKDYVEVMFKEHRKLRGSINVCFQTVGDLTKTGIASVILEQCPTRFLFPNPSGKREDYALFDLSEAEWAYIKGQGRLNKTLKHSVLVKRACESVILNCDMSPLGPYLKLYKSGAEPVKIVKELQQHWGQNQWIDTYLNAV